MKASDDLAGITAQLGSGANSFYLRPWEKTALLSAIFLSVLISAVRTVLYRLAYSDWPQVPVWYYRVFLLQFTLLVLNMVATIAGLM